MTGLLLSITVGSIVAIIIALVLVLGFIVAVFLTGYKKCPKNKIIVVYGLLGKNPDCTRNNMKCVCGGATFVIPIIQSYGYLDLTPISIDVDFRSDLSTENIRVDFPQRFTVQVASEGEVMQNAAERLLGMSSTEIQSLAKDIILGQLRLVIEHMGVEAINNDKDKFIEESAKSVKSELKKIGLKLSKIQTTSGLDKFI